MKRPLDNCGYQPERSLRAYQGAFYHSPQPFEINEVVYTLLSHVNDLATICNMNNVSKRCRLIVQTFLQHGLGAILPKNVPSKITKIVDIAKLIAYANKNNFSLDNIKNIFINEDKEDLDSLIKFKNLEYVYVNNCKSLIDFSHFKFLKVLDLSFCTPTNGLRFPAHESCPSLEKLKLHKCLYFRPSLTAFLSDEKFSQKKFTLISYTGEKYTGYFKNGQYHGKGKIRYAPLITIKGDFAGGIRKEGRIFARHRIRSSLGDIDTYEGDFENGKRHGKGIYKHTDGSIYEGDFNNDLCHGEGKLICTSNNRTYKGEFKKGYLAWRELALDSDQIRFQKKIDIALNIRLTLKEFYETPIRQF